MAGSDKAAHEGESGNSDVDITVWKDWQKRWFWKVFRKNLVVMTVYVALAVGFILSVEVDTKFHALMVRESTEVYLRRLMLTIVMCGFSLLVYYINTFHGVAPQKWDVKYKLLRDNVGGHFVYLTVNILWGHVVYWVCCVIAEYIRWSGQLRGHMARQLLLACHVVSMFSNTMGIVLTVLFLKFNYFEPGWIKNVYNVYKSRGYRFWIYKMLFLHCSQFFIAFADVLVIKDRMVLYESTPTLLTLAQVSLVYTFIYIVWVHVNKYACDGYVPYPILEKVFKSWRLEAMFVLAVSTLVLVCSIGIHILGTIKLPYIDYPVSA